MSSTFNPLLPYGIDETTSVTVPPGSGDVVGPASATDGHIAVFDGVTGKLLKDGGPVPTGGGGLTVPVEMVTTDTEPLAADRLDGWLIFLKDVAVLKIRDTVAGIAKWRELGGSSGGNKFGSAKFGSAKLA